MSTCFPGVAAVSGLSSLCHCCILGPSIVSSQPSVLYDCDLYTVPFLHSGSSICGWWPNSSGTHHRPGAVSLAVSGTLQLDAGPLIGPPVLR
jgi:hypothetical protein